MSRGVCVRCGGPTGNSPGGHCQACHVELVRRPATVRFWEKVDTSAGLFGCWPWLAQRSASGHGRFRPSEGEPQGMAHRFAYELLAGPIPEGLTLDHLCRNRACVNPGHLEPVTNRENVLRGEGPSAVNSRLTHCRAGHEFNAVNTRYSGGRRHCRPCRAQWLRDRRAAA